MSLGITELRDLIKIVALLNIGSEEIAQKSLIEDRLGRICADHLCIETNDLDQAINEMVSEKLVTSHEGTIQLTKTGRRLSRDWKSLLLKREPIIEVVAGLTDGSITGLVVILTAFLAGLVSSIALFAGFLTLGSVAITNFSSFFLGGITEDISDLKTLQSLVDHSLSGNPDLEDRDKSLRLVNQLFTVLHQQISRSNIYAATLCGATTFLAGFIPIATYLVLPEPFHIILSLSIVGIFVGIFLVGYRSRSAKVHWKITLFETVMIVFIAVIASLLLGAV